MPVQLCAAILKQKHVCVSGRYQAGVCSMDGLVFAAGGCDAWNCLSSVEVYDPQTDLWTYAKGMITARRGCGLSFFNGKFIRLEQSGRDMGSHFSMVRYYI